MKFPPRFSLTSAIQKLLYDIDVLKESYLLHPVSHERAVLLRRVSLLKSSLFSAKIEGNPLELADIQSIEEKSNDVKKQEVANLVQAYERLPNLTSETMTIGTLKSFHQTILQHISAETGRLRTEESAIFSESGVAVYLTPAPKEIGGLLSGLCAYILESRDPIPVVAAVGHIWFEKIHPFLDGNGRVGRLLSAYILKKGGYDFSGLVPFEEYLEKHREEYYQALGKDRQDVTEFVEFYLTALLSQVRRSLKLAYEPEAPNPYDSLLPRRAEILRIIQDHKVVTFDFLSRRFRAVPKRTLHHDVAKLVKGGWVRKLGTTRGAVYVPAGQTCPGPWKN